MAPCWTLHHRAVQRTAPPPPKVLSLTSRYAPWDCKLLGTQTVSRWAEVVSTILHSEEVGQRVVDTLLQIAPIDSLRPHISNNVWTWLKKRSPLPPRCQG